MPMWSVSLDFMGLWVWLGRKIPRFLKSSLCSSPAWIACFLQPFEISEEGRRTAQATGRTRVQGGSSGSVGQSSCFPSESYHRPDTQAGCQASTFAPTRMRLTIRLIFGCCCVAATFALFIFFTLTHLRVVESSTGHEPVTRGLFSWLEFNCYPRDTSKRGYESFMFMRGYEGYMYSLHWPRLLAEITLSTILGVGFTAFVWCAAARLVIRSSAESKPRANKP